MITNWLCAKRQNFNWLNHQKTPEKSLYFTKALQCKVIKSLVIYWIKVRELWVLYKCVLCQFSVSPHMYTPILPDKLQKDYKTFSIWLQNKDKTETHNTLCNFSKSPHIWKLLIVWLGTLCGLCILPYMHGLRSALVSVADQAAYAVLGRVGIERARVWVCLTVLCICNCRCKIYYTL